MSDVKAKFRDELDRFAKQHFGTGISSLKEMQRSDALTLCYALQIRNSLLPGSLPDDFEELKNFICDGKNDRTVDFIHRDDNRHVTIIQTKHRAAEKAEATNEFEAFRKCVERLCPETRPTTTISQSLLDLISDIDWENDNFTLIYLSLARHNPALEERAGQGLDDVPNSPLRDLSSRSDILYLSEDEVNKLWRDVLGQRDGNNPEVEILLSAPNATAVDQFLLFDNEANGKSYVCLLSASQVHALYQRWRDRLFNLNIRNYIGDTRTNKDIMLTAANNPDNFFFYNNGVSAVASKVSVVQRGSQCVLRCRDFSIINGAQTFRSISKAHTKSGSDTRRLRVLLRISEFDFRSSKNADRLDSITKYNNTQNAVRVSDFRSNDKVQTSIARYVSEVAAYDGKTFVYKNKRSGSAERGKTSIKMDDFCRATFSFLKGPPDFFGGLPHLYDTGTGGRVR